MTGEKLSPTTGSTPVGNPPTAEEPGAGRIGLAEVTLSSESVASACWAATGATIAPDVRPAPDSIVPASQILDRLVRITPLKNYVIMFHPRERLFPQGGRAQMDGWSPPVAELHQRHQRHAPLRRKRRLREAWRRQTSLLVISLSLLGTTVRMLGLLLLGLFLLPLGTHALWWTARGGGAADWAVADWSSAGLLRPPKATDPALVRVYAARVGRWRGIFAHHSWIVVKPAGAARYTRYDVVGWGMPVRTDGWAADGRWFGNDPQTILALDGDDAARAIPAIRAAVADYPYRALGTYRAWPGPNSNSFAAHVLARLPEPQVTLPPTALGKDWAPPGRIVERTPSGTGIRLTVGGYAGITVGWVEGVEINLLGLVAGLDLRRPAIKLPGWGRIGVA